MKIALLGDIAPFGRYCLNNDTSAIAQFEAVEAFLRDHDLVVGNLETPFVDLDTDRAVSGKSATIHAHPDNVALLQSLGVTHVTLSNNHIGDYGYSAYARTKAILEAAGIGWFGTEGKQIDVEHAGEKVALLGYCSYNTNPSPVIRDRIDLLNYLSVRDVRVALERNASRGFLSVLAVHSGQEHVHYPSSHDVTFARALAQHVDYVYYGHHPHVVQGCETVGASSLFYSLGNFVFDDVYTAYDADKPLVELSEANKTGVIGTVRVEGGKITESEVTPIYLGANRVMVGHEVGPFDMQEYNERLQSAGTAEYDGFRTALIREFIEERRGARDLKWYRDRLNLNSLGIIFKAKRNAKRYRQLFSSQLPTLDSRP